jgi:hypothetical protein
MKNASIIPFMICLLIVIVLKLGLDWLIWDFADAGLEPGQVKKKTREEKIRCDPTTRLKTQLQFINFCFFFLLKQHCFDFF